MSKPKLQLTSTVNNVNDYEEFQVQISTDGSLVYLANIQLPAIVNAVQTLYANNNGILTQIAVTSALPAAYTGYTVSAGAANKDFTLFALLILPPPTTTPVAVTGAILIYNLVSNNFNLIKSLAVPDILGTFPFFNLSQYSFSPDSRYLATVYSSFSLSPTPTTPVGILQVYDISGSTIVPVGPTIQTPSYSSGASFFTLKSHHGVQTYLVNGATTFTGTNFLVLAASAPSNVSFYSFHNGVLTQVGPSIDQPQEVAIVLPYTFKTSKSTYVIVALALALNPGEPTTLDVTQTVPPNNNSTFIPGDNRNLRIYEFNGSTASLANAKHIDASLLSAAWYPSGNVFALVYTAGLTNLNNLTCSSSFVPSVQQNVVQLFKLSCCKGHLQVNPYGIAYTAPETAIEQFSANGEWFIIGGGGPVLASNIITTNLYRVVR